MKKATYITLILSMMFWGTTPFFSESLLTTYAYCTPITLLFLRLAISAGLLWVIMLLFFRDKICFRKSDIKYYLLLGLFEPFLYFIGETYGLLEVGPTITSAMVATIPIYVLISNAIFYREKMGWTGWIGTVVSFLGVWMMLLNDNMELNFNLRGMLFLCFAAMSSVGYALTAQKLSSDYSPVFITTIQNTIGFVYFSITMFVMERHNLSMIPMDTNFVWQLLVLAVFGSTLAFLFYVIGIQQLGSTKAAVFANTIPIFTLLFAILQHTDNINITKFLGVFVVCMGVTLSQQRKSKKELMEGKR